MVARREAGHQSALNFQRRSVEVAAASPGRELRPGHEADVAPLLRRGRGSA